ncbi:Dynamin family-domain-containing protein [Colletotrichum navitas]|uniref:Dynamin family-domain-containing protein n=1 Tax=Colletotrichum navitas TaxID=681940 RepID=A0AAD8PPP1_9PEZI|nr:Dynamin family-domain-containing protein [Colletotrichum navitas]KAK1573636.1 Dynamin family-domain-containing protein [Colletotrichum navitas]
MVFSYTQTMTQVKDPETWEKFTLQVLPLLEDLKPICERIASSEKLSAELKDAAHNWKQQACDIRRTFDHEERVVIGVLGNTGDGKSSLINAVLHENSLLPTNVMRACTAVVTEVSYNHDDDKESPYRAEVEFISRDEWMREVSILFKQLDTNGGSMKDDKNADSDAARARAKLKAVYPSLDMQRLATKSPAKLADLPDVREVLGTTKTMKASNTTDIKSLLKPFIDSKDKDDDTAAHWPLVKAVKIFTKAEALSSGIIIVDLPGHQDWDAARTAVASQYMEKCSGIWIVTPIHRAVDSKTAKDLMSKSIQRQIMFDGSSSALTIVCSKTDDIQLDAAMESLSEKLHKSTVEKWETAKALDQQIKALVKEVHSARKRRGVTQEPGASGGKQRQAKRARTEPPVQLVDADEIQEVDDEKFQDYTSAMTTEEKQHEISELKLQKNELMDEVWSHCIQKRNEISKEAVRRNFAESFQAIDSHRKATEPHDARPRDYGDLARRTPVFCTSSDAYQKMHGIVLSHEDSQPGYETEEDTEIPQLRTHTQKVVEELRIDKYKAVLSGICQILNSIAIWAQDTSGPAMAIDVQNLTASLQNFEAVLGEEIGNCKDELQITTQTSLYDELARLSRIAVTYAGITAKKWETIQWNVFKAACRRRGVYQEHDFNEELLEPIKGDLLATWEKVFQFDIPGVLDNFSVTTTQQLISFHNSIMQQVIDHDDEEMDASVQLGQQLKFHQYRVMLLAAQNRAYINQAQRVASRACGSAVVRFMASGYDKCADVKGHGTADRMRAIIREHIDYYKDAMFREAVRDVKRNIQKGVKLAEKNMTAQIEAIVTTMKSDYMLALAEREKSIRRLESSFKQSMMEVLEKAEIRFA